MPIARFFGIPDCFRRTNRAFYGLIASLALPVVLQNLITVGVNIMDTVMLGSYGEVQLSASSLANDFINIYQIFCMGLGGGAAVLTAQFWGKGDLPSLRKTVVIMTGIAMALAAVFTALVLLVPEAIMRIYTNDPEVIAKGAVYFRVSAPTFLLLSLSLPLTLVLRSVRRVRVPLFTAILCFFVNVFFNWVFIFGNLGAPEMQIAGAALGTVIARVVEAAVIAVYVFRVDRAIGLRVRHLFEKVGDLFTTYLRYGAPVIVSDALLAFGNSAVSVVIGRMGTSFVAANAIIATIVRLSTVFNQGLAQASSIVTGNTIGRGEPDRAYREGVVMTCLSFLIGVAAGGIILLLSPVVIGMYNITEETRLIAWEFMYAVSLMVVFQALQSVLTKGVLRGGGDTRFLMVTDVLFLWLLSIPLGAVCALVLGAPPFWIYVTLKIDWIVKTVICLRRLASRKWMRSVSA